MQKLFYNSAVFQLLEIIENFAPVLHADLDSGLFSAGIHDKLHTFQSVKSNHLNLCKYYTRNPGGSRRLRDEGFGKVVVEVGGVHIV